MTGEPEFRENRDEMLVLPKFYVTTHRPNWLWDGRVEFPLMVSYRTLRTVRNLRRAKVRWCLDSGGFSELTVHGRWTFPVREYVAAVAGLDRKIGGLEFAATQDWMCEPEVIHGGRLGSTRAAGTGLSVGEHQRRTVEAFCEAERLWPEYSDEECPFMPALQGYQPGEYEMCRRLYEEAGVDLSEYPVVPVGSVCRRSSTAAIRDVVNAVSAMDISTHWFGVKLSGVRLAGIAQGEIRRGDGELYPHGAASLDSAAWSFDARYGRPIGDGKCAHAGKCSNCHRYAALYRQRVLAALRAAHQARLEGGGPEYRPGPRRPAYIQETLEFAS